MKKLFIYSYSNASQSAKRLAEALGCRLIKHRNSRFVPSKNKAVVSWGSSRIPFAFNSVAGYLNLPVPVSIAKNKLECLKVLNDNNVSIPSFTESIETAKTWIAEGHSVCARATLFGKEGEGLTIHTTVDTVPNVPLYTLYIKKLKEFRVHVFLDEVIDTVEKKKKKGVEARDTRIRNTANGYVFCREGIQVPQCVTEEAVKATKALGLDFGGVDVVYNSKYNKAYVLEVNTAPGIEGTTVQKYKEAIQKWLQGVQ